MFNKQNIFTIVSLTLCLGLLNCTHKAEDVLDSLSSGGGGGGQGGDVVKQQNLGGLYVSDCLQYPLGGMRTISLSVDKQQVTIETDFFNGSDCSTLNRKETLKGKLYDQGSTVSGLHLVKFWIPVDEHVSTWRYYNMRFGTDLIRTSEFAIDPKDLKGVEPKIDLKRTSPVPPQGGHIMLTPGEYGVTSGNSQACPQNIGVMSTGGQVAQLFVTYEAPCAAHTTTFSCSNDVCQTPGSVIRLISNSSYSYENQTANWTATFTRK